MANQTWHCRIEGRVQGVWFRASTRDQALRLGLTGWVRNCDDGSVECVISGETAALTEMQNWLQHGPPLAEVTNVSIKTIEWCEFPNFEVKR